MSRDRPTVAVAMSSAQVMRTYLAISGCFTLSASVIWGVNTLFLVDAGLDIFEVFVANAAYAAGTALFEIPTGVVADTSGRRRSFLLSASTLLVGTLGYVGVAAYGGGLLPFVLLSIVLGLGFSFYSGAVEAWLVDALRATGYEAQLDHVFARGSMVSGAAMLVGTVGGGFLGSVDLAWPFLVRAGLLAVVFLIGRKAMHDVGFTPRTTSLSAMPTEMKTVLRTSVRFGWGTHSVRLLMIVSLVHGVFMMWGFYAWPPYFLELLGHDAVWVAGVVSALIALSTILGNAMVDVFARFCGKRTTLLITASSAMAMAAAGVGAVESFWPAVVLLLLAIGAMGVVAPVQQAYLHQLVPSEQRATVVSFGSLLASAGGVSGQLGLGYLSRAQSVATAYVTGGVTMLFTLPWLFLLRRGHDPADVIIGRRAGKRAPCAAQGLPEVSQLDTTARQPIAAP